MNIKITISTKTPAFVNRERAELAETLRKLADQLDYSGFLCEDTKLPLIDRDGKTVGYLTVK